MNQIRKLIEGLFVCNSKLLTFENSSIKKLLPNIRVFQLMNNEGDFNFKSLSVFTKLESLQVNSTNVNQSFFDYLKKQSNFYYVGISDFVVNNSFFKKLEGICSNIDNLRLLGRVQDSNEPFM